VILFSQKKILFVALSLFLANFADAAPFGLNDVSILLPLPSSQAISSMLSPADQGAQGTLLPKDIYRHFPALDDRFDAESLYDNNFKVVGIRIDPCFFESPSTTCRRQIRMVWQPLVVLRGKTSTLDASIHTFYEFNESEWRIVLKKWADIAKGDLSQGLQINPTLKSEGYTGATWTQLKKIILESCGDKSLTRVTGMQVTASRVWTFRGYDRSSGDWINMSIPRVNGTLQAFVLQPEVLFNLDQFQGTLAPAPGSEDSFLSLIANSQDFKNRTSASDVSTLMSHVIQFENPGVHNPGTLDCVSCHLAQTTRLWGENNFPKWDWKNGFNSSRYPSDLNLENNSVNPFNVNRLRAFGYFDADPILSQRVVNETANVSKTLNSAL
jgi:hypothetical protein